MEQGSQGITPSLVLDNVGNMGISAK